MVPCLLVAANRTTDRPLEFRVYGESGILCYDSVACMLSLAVISIHSVFGGGVCLNLFVLLQGP